MLHLKVLEKYEQAKPKLRRREAIKIMAKINERDQKKQTKNQQNQKLFFEKLNKMDKCLANLT
jgi:hypothetical protein